MGAALEPSVQTIRSKAIIVAKFVSGKEWTYIGPRRL